ncbi:hypothetical protein C8J56DRAFT_892779 [Mycena floridula]|nr:hypothetical protein C8J56DRAFT_892779 [Mycena floridula]
MSYSWMGPCKTRFITNSTEEFRKFKKEAEIKDDDTAITNADGSITLKVDFVVKATDVEGNPVTASALAAGSSEPGPKVGIGAGSSFSRIPLQPDGSLKVDEYRRVLGSDGDIAQHPNLETSTYRRVEHWNDLFGGPTTPLLRLGRCWGIEEKVVAVSSTQHDPICAKDTQLMHSSKMPGGEAVRGGGGVDIMKIDISSEERRSAEGSTRKDELERITRKKGRIE